MADQPHAKPPARWWLEPAAFFLVGLAAILSALVLQPGPGEEWTYFLGEQLGGPCEFRESSGRPCPTCGMTRSWVRAARGQVGAALRFHPAGTVLFYGLATTGVLGGIRLLRRDPSAFRIRPKWLMVGVLCWVFLHVTQWALRLTGWLPLP